MIFFSVAVIIVVTITTAAVEGTLPLAQNPMSMHTCRQEMETCDKNHIICCVIWIQHLITTAAHFFCCFSYPFSVIMSALWTTMKSKYYWRRLEITLYEIAIKNTHMRKRSCNSNVIDFYIIKHPIYMQYARFLSNILAFSMRIEFGIFFISSVNRIISSTTRSLQNINVK